jgi:hypothetical protein
MMFRWWFVSMGVTVVLVLASMMYLGSFVCLPMGGHDTCTSLLPEEGKMVTAATPIVTSVAPVTPVNPVSPP